MQTLRPLLTPLRLSTSSCSRPLTLPKTLPTHQHRTFVNPFAGSSVQTLSATRTIRGPAKIIYTVISDVSSYHHFVPYCLESTVTKQSQPTTSDGKRYAEEARLVIGFGQGGTSAGGGGGGMNETFWSRVYCAPGRGVVEAVAGRAETSLGKSDIEHHSAREEGARDPTREVRVLEHLLTRWSLREVGGSGTPAETEVRLAIEYQFANPLYGALSAAAAPMVAEKMIEAFQTRAKAILEKSGVQGGKA